jgi:hypothetical protein
MGEGWIRQPVRTKQQLELAFFFFFFFGASFCFKHFKSIQVFYLCNNFILPIGKLRFLCPGIWSMIEPGLELLVVSPV